MYMNLCKMPIESEGIELALDRSKRRLKENMKIL